VSRPDDAGGIVARWIVMNDRGAILPSMLSGALRPRSRSWIDVRTPSRPFRPTRDPEERQAGSSEATAEEMRVDGDLRVGFFQICERGLPATRVAASAA
jgi:hypothetical protein